MKDKIKKALENDELEKLIMGEDDYYVSGREEVFHKMQGYDMLLSSLYAFAEENPDTILNEKFEKALLNLLNSMDGRAVYYACICLLTQIDYEKPNDKFKLKDKEILLKAAKDGIIRMQNAIKELIAYKYNFRSVNDANDFYSHVELEINKKIGNLGR